MKQCLSPRDLNKEELRQSLWYYLQDNPMTIFQIMRDTGLSQNTIQAFLDPESNRRFGLNILLVINKFLRTKYAERDAAMMKE